MEPEKCAWLKLPLPAMVSSSIESPSSIAPEDDPESIWGGCPHLGYRTVPAQSPKNA